MGLEKIWGWKRYGAGKAAESKLYWDGIEGENQACMNQFANQ